MRVKSAETRATADHPAAVSPGLRERRRLQTRAEITDAALRLFAEGGVASTTVDDIAAAAGVSARTFFRYFATKEEAALPVHQDFNEAIAAGLPSVDPQGDVRDEVDRLYALTVLPYTDNDSPSAQRMLQVSQLIRKEPSLRSAQVRQTVERTEDLMAALSAKFGPERADQMELRLAIDISGAVARAALDTWVGLLEAGKAADLAEIYGQARAFAR